jgi:lysozyme
VIKRALAALSTPFNTNVPVPVKMSATGVRIVPEHVVDMIISYEKMYRIGPDGLVYPYHDALGYPTIGIGRLLSRVKYEPLTKYTPITIEQAKIDFHIDLDKFAIGVSRLCKVAISDNQFGALVSLSFNIGLGNLQASSLIRKLNRGDSHEDVGNEFLKWNMGGGKILPGLTRRRISEKTIFLS